MAKGIKMVLVLMESMAGTGHNYAALREKIAAKLEHYRFDPAVRQWVMYKESKKIKTLRKK